MLLYNITKAFIAQDILCKHTISIPDITILDEAYLIVFLSLIITKDRISVIYTLYQREITIILYFFLKTTLIGSGH